MHYYQLFRCLKVYLSLLWLLGRQVRSMQQYYQQRYYHYLTKILRKNLISLKQEGQSFSAKNYIDNWSFWSPPYEFAAGQRNDKAQAWEDGTPMLSPAPSRYFQISIKLFAACDVAPQLDQLSLQLSEALSAQTLVGEIWPIEVNNFAPTPFTYVVLPTLEADNAGFDRLEILPHVRADTLHSVAIDGEQISRDQFKPQLLDARIIVTFPPLAGTAENRTQIEVEVAVPVLRFGTEV